MSIKKYFGLGYLQELYISGRMFCHDKKWLKLCFQNGNDKRTSLWNTDKHCSEHMREWHRNQNYIKINSSYYFIYLTNIRCRPTAHYINIKNIKRVYRTKDKFNIIPTNKLKLINEKVK